MVGSVRAVVVGVVSSALLVLTGWSAAGASPEAGQGADPLPWTSGASGAGVADGSFGEWRGSPVSIAGSWSDSAAGQLELWPLHGEFADWSGDLELAVGAIDRGETWAQAAQGAYDERWAESLRRAAGLWAAHTGTLYLRFAHEFNGSWFPWSVTPASVGDFITAWHRFRALQQELFPSARLVFSPNRESAGSFGADWRQAFPGPGQADVVSVSYYNGWPFLDSAESFQETALSYDQFGGPRGIQRHLEFAREVGLPFAVSEWGAHAAFGDSAAWMEQMHAFFAANAGTGPGQLRYEIYFNVVQDDNAFSLFPQTRLPRSAEVYARLW